MANSMNSPVSRQEPQQLQSISSLWLQQSFSDCSPSADQRMYLYEGKQRLTALSHVSGRRTMNSWKRQCKQASSRAAQSSVGKGQTDGHPVTGCQALTPNPRPVHTKSICRRPRPVKGRFRSIPEA